MHVTYHYPPFMTIHPDDYIHALVAQHLRSRGLNATCDQLERELNRKFSLDPLEESLEAIVKDRVNFNALSPLEESPNVGCGETHGIKPWDIDCPSRVQQLPLPPVLFISTSTWSFQDTAWQLMVTNTNRLLVYNVDGNILYKDIPGPLAQPLKTVAACGPYIFLSDMNGTLEVFEVDSNWNLVSVLAGGPIKLHRRLITDFKVLQIDNLDTPNLIAYFASIGWDGRLMVGKIVKTDSLLEATIIGEFKLASNPTSLCLALDTRTNLPLLLAGRLDSSLLALFAVTQDDVIEVARVSLNDAQFSSHGFQAMSIAHMGNGVFSVGTDHIPFMRLVTVALPTMDKILATQHNMESLSIDEALKKLHLSQDSVQTLHTQTPVLRGTIVSNYNTLCPQDKYSSAIVLPRKSGGVWIPADDGIVRGIDLTTGRVVTELNTGDGRAKCASIGAAASGEYVLVCGAMDKKASLWIC